MTNKQEILRRSLNLSFDLETEVWQGHPHKKKIADMTPAEEADEIVRRLTAAPEIDTFGGELAEIMAMCIRTEIDAAVLNGISPAISPWGKK